MHAGSGTESRPPGWSLLLDPRSTARLGRRAQRRSRFCSVPAIGRSSSVRLTPAGAAKQEPGRASDYVKSCFEDALAATIGAVAEILILWAASPRTPAPASARRLVVSERFV